MLTGNSLARQGMLQKAVTDAAMLDQRDRALQEESIYHQGLIDTALGRDRSLNQQRQIQNEFERRRVELQEALGVASLNKDVLAQTKLIKEITELDKVAAAYDRASQTKDIGSLNVADRARLNVTAPEEREGYHDLFTDKNGNVVYKKRSEQSDLTGLTPFNKESGALTENQKRQLSQAIAEEEFQLKNLDDPTVAGSMDFVNKYGDKPYFYIQRVEKGGWSGTKLKGYRLPLPVVNGQQYTAKDIYELSAQNNGMPIEEVLTILMAWPEQREQK